MLGDALAQAAVAGFLYIIPALSIALLVRGISDPRRETWKVTTDAERSKQRYRAWARVGTRINHLMVAAFFVHLAGLVALASAGCDETSTHLAAAGMNIVTATDPMWLVGFIGLVGLDAAGAFHGIRYGYLNRKHAWGDPRAWDYAIVHLGLLPLALLLLFIAFGAAPRLLCGS